MRPPLPHSKLQKLVPLLFYLPLQLKAMASSSLSLLFLYLLVLLSLGHGNVEQNNCQKTWCVAKPSTDEVALYNNIQYACSAVDCSIIQKGGACFSPETNISHASVAMNLYYQSKGMNPWNCYFSFSGISVVTDPSYGDCKYV